MSLTMRVFCFLRNAKKLSQSHLLQIYLMIPLTFFLVLGFFFNSYSSIQGNYETYNILDTYEEVDEFSTLSTKTEGKHSHKSQGFQMTDFAGNAMDLMYPQANANYNAILASPDISMASKLGLIGAVDVPITAMLYNPPYIDIPEHLAQQWIPNYDQTAGVYAQGYEMLGASAGISDLWSMSRNIAYMFFVIVFIIAGFMIMFRHKLQGSTMVTVYNTLPSIIVGLVLVTFSFAIVGLIIDVGAVLIRVIAGELNISDPVDATNPFGLMLTYATDVTGHYIIQAFTDSVLSFVAGLLFFAMSGLISLFIMLAVVGVIAYISIKIFFTLVKAYIGILFDTIAAPIVFAIATIPGKQGMMKDWFNRVAKNVMVFVLVFTLINLPLFFIDVGLGDGMALFGGDLGATGMQTGGWSGSIIMLGVSFYMLFLAANVPKMLEDYFPQTGGKGSSEAAAGAKKDMGKIPLVGGFFKG